MILLVDDTTDNIQVLNAILRGDHKIKAATSGQRALVLARQMPAPDLILLDIMMPGMDGHEVCRQLKADPETAGIPVIFITAKSEETDETLGFKLGAVDYITKPIRPPVVRARVDTHLRLRQAQRLLESQKSALEEAARLRDDVERITRHDLKAPLNGIIALPGLLAQRYPFSDKDAALLKNIERSGRKMLDMINRSLDLYKMETGTYVLRAQSLDLLPLLRSVLEEIALSPIARDKTWTLHLNGQSLAEGMQCWVEAESMLCYPMFANLLQNAFEASPQKAGVALELAVEGPRVAVRILNQGLIPEAIRANFFGKYVTHGKTQGTGLGTYSARLCAETQGGSIAVETLADTYTAITVTLPALVRDGTR